MSCFKPFKKIFVLFDYKVQKRKSILQLKDVLVFACHLYQNFTASRSVSLTSLLYMWIVEMVEQQPILIHESRQKVQITPE